jgi:hypothetical protein
MKEADMSTERIAAALESILGLVQQAEARGTQNGETLKRLRAAEEAAETLETRNQELVREVEQLRARNKVQQQKLDDLAAAWAANLQRELDKTAERLAPASAAEAAERLYCFFADVNLNSEDGDHFKRLCREKNFVATRSVAEWVSAAKKDLDLFFRE